MSGVLPPRTTLSRHGPLTRRGTAAISSSVCGASTKAISAPEARAALTRAIASSKPATARVGARDNHEIPVATGGDGGADLCQIILARDDLFAFEMTTFLREFLILDVDSRDAAALKFAHGAKHVELVAVAGVGIGDHRHFDCGGKTPGIGDHFRHRNEAEIGVSQTCRRTGTRHVDGGETGLLDQLGGDAVVSARRHDYPVPLQQCAETATLRHLSLRSTGSNEARPYPAVSSSPSAHPSLDSTGRLQAERRRPPMYAFSLTTEQQFDPKSTWKEWLGASGEGDVTIACWEPGQTSPYHCHPTPPRSTSASRAAARCGPRAKRSRSNRERLSSTHAASCTNTPTALCVPCCSAYAMVGRCPAGPRNGRATRTGLHVPRTSNTSDRTRLASVPGQVLACLRPW